MNPQQAKNIDSLIIILGRHFPSASFNQLQKAAKDIEGLKSSNVKPMTKEEIKEIIDRVPPKEKEADCAPKTPWDDLFPPYKPMKPWIAPPNDGWGPTLGAPTCVTLWGVYPNKGNTSY